MMRWLLPFLVLIIGSTSACREESNSGDSEPAREVSARPSSNPQESEKRLTSPPRIVPGPIIDKTDPVTEDLAIPSAEVRRRLEYLVLPDRFYYQLQDVIHENAQWRAGEGDR